MRRQLLPLNEAITSAVIELPGYTGDLWSLPSENGVNHIRPHGALRQIFNRESFSMGGRAYGWWQNLPKPWRAKLTINGEEVVELDYSALHPAMLYAERGLPLAGDPYCIDGHPRGRAGAGFGSCRAT